MRTLEKTRHILCRRGEAYSRVRWYRLVWARNDDARAVDIEGALTRAACELGQAEAPGEPLAVVAGFEFEDGIEPGLYHLGMEDSVGETLTRLVRESPVWLMPGNKVVKSRALRETGSSITCFTSIVAVTVAV